MVAYSFKPRFVEPILAGTKGGTIRNDRKRHARPEEVLQLYTGMRTNRCRLITRQTCLAAMAITLRFQGPRSGDRPSVLIHDPDSPRAEHVFTSPRDLDAFARFDDFDDWAEMVTFWREEHAAIEEFRGVHIRWLDWPEALR